MTRDRCFETLYWQIMLGLRNFDARDRMEIFNEMTVKIQAELLRQPRRSPSAEYSIQLPDEVKR